MQNMKQFVNMDKIDRWMSHNARKIQDCTAAQVYLKAIKQEHLNTSAENPT